MTFPDPFSDWPAALVFGRGRVLGRLRLSQLDGVSRFWITAKSSDGTCRTRNATTNGRRMGAVFRRCRRVRIMRLLKDLGSM